MKRNGICNHNVLLNNGNVTYRRCTSDELSNGSKSNTNTICGRIKDRSEQGKDRECVCIRNDITFSADPRPSLKPLHAHCGKVAVSTLRCKFLCVAISFSVQILHFKGIIPLNDFIIASPLHTQPLHFSALCIHTHLTGKYDKVVAISNAYKLHKMGERERKDGQTDTARKKVRDFKSS